MSARRTDPLMAGFFSVTDAARLLSASPAMIRGWLNGYPNSRSGPVIDRDFAGTRAVSFLDLMELRFIAFFRAHDVPMPTLRLAAERAREEWKVTHPLALSSQKYVSNRRRVFARAAKEAEDKSTWDMATGQHEMWEMLEKTIERQPKPQARLSESSNHQFIRPETAGLLVAVSGLKAGQRLVGAATDFGIGQT